VSIDRIEISGNTKTRDKVIRRELELEEQGSSPAPLSAAARIASPPRVLRGRQHHHPQGRLRGQLDMIVDVREGNTGAFSAGAGISSVSRSCSTSACPSRTCSAAARLGVQRRLRLDPPQHQPQLHEPYFLDTPLTVGLDLFNWELEFDQFTRGGTGGGIRTLYPFRPSASTCSTSARSARCRCSIPASVSSTDRECRDLQRRAQRRHRPARRGRHQPHQLDHPARLPRHAQQPPRPDVGSFQDFSIEIAGLGGDSDFINAQSRARWYIPVWQIPKLGR
jgi:outer membrane protein assembly factor BamA